MAGNKALQGGSTLCRRAKWLTSVFAFMLMLVPPSAWAQSPVASYFSQMDPQGNAEAAGHCLRSFSGELLAAGLVERPSAEIETIVRDCVEDLSNPSFAQQCDLSVARGQVNYVFIVGAQQDGEDWLFYIQALSPMMAGAVWQRDELTSAESALRAARDVCGSLALDFLVQEEFVESSAAVSISGGGVAVLQAALDLPAVVHVVSVTPSPAAVYVNGQETGTAPGQFEVPAGVGTNVELRSPGYLSWTQTVTVEAGGLESISGITLVALPSTLQLTANVQGGEIVVDGAVVGRTIMNRMVSLELPAGTRRVSVRLEGFDEYRSEVTLAPGATQSLTATLSATPAAPPVVNPPPVVNSPPVAAQPNTSGFVYIAPGTFTMGSPRNEEGRSQDETQHQVTLTRGFYLQATEVTQGEWQRVMGNNPSSFSSCGIDCPVEQVSWLDAVGYANALSRADGYSECYDSSGNVRGGGSIYACTGYRLPTEAEWEYAARAGSTGAQYGMLDQIGWYFVNSSDQTHRVGERQANAWGLYDMLGNVWEWTHDWYAFYRGSVSDPMGPATGSYRGFRGGGWGDGASSVRSSARGSYGPSDLSRDVGFRLARTAN
jgi:formylglycine-generating enzyme required for sulfatase activity